VEEWRRGGREEEVGVEGEMGEGRRWRGREEEVEEGEGRGFRV